MTLPAFEPAPVTPIDGGWRFGLNITADRYIDILVMFTGCRIVTTYVDMPLTWERGWCYYGNNSLLRAVLSAMAWDGSHDTEPDGWDKNLQTGKYRGG